MAVVTKKLRRGDVCLVELDPTRGTEIRKTRPCVIISPDELNDHLRTVIVAPLTSAGRPSPFRVSCKFARKDGLVVIDQIRTVDRERLVKRLGALQQDTLVQVLGVLREMFDL